MITDSQFCDIGDPLGPMGLFKSVAFIRTALKVRAEMTANAGSTDVGKTISREVVSDATNEVVGKFIYSITENDKLHVEFMRNEKFHDDTVLEYAQTTIDTMMGFYNELTPQQINEFKEDEDEHLHKLTLQSLKDDIKTLNRPTSKALTELWELELEKNPRVNRNNLSRGGVRISSYGRYLSCSLEIRPMLDVNGDFCYYISDLEFFFSASGVEPNSFPSKEVLEKTIDYLFNKDLFKLDNDIQYITSIQLWVAEAVDREEMLENVVARIKSGDLKLT